MNAPLTPWQATQARNADAQIKADAIEQREVDALEGLYAGLLPKQEPTLRQLAERAISARYSFHEFDRSEASDGERIKWAEMNLADWKAVSDFKSALVDLTGIPRTMWLALMEEGILP